MKMKTSAALRAPLFNGFVARGAFKEILLESVLVTPANAGVQLSSFCLPSRMAFLFLSASDSPPNCKWLRSHFAEARSS